MLCINKGRKGCSAHATCFFNGLRAQGIGGGVADVVAVVGDIGGGETIRWGVNGVIPGGVYSLGLVLGRGSSFMGEGLAGAAGLGDLVVI